MYKIQILFLQKVKKFKINFKRKDAYNREYNLSNLNKSCDYYIIYFTYNNKVYNLYGIDKKNNKENSTWLIKKYLILYNKINNTYFSLLQYHHLSLFSDKEKKNLDIHKFFAKFHYLNDESLSNNLINKNYFVDYKKYFLLIIDNFCKKKLIYDLNNIIFNYL